MTSKSASKAFNRAIKRDRLLRKRREQGQKGWKPKKLCTPRSPCRLLSCNCCRVSSQEKFIEEFLPMALRRQAEAVAAGSCMQAITIIPSSGRMPRGKLSEADLVGIRRQVLRAIRKHAPKAKVFLWMDISLNCGAKVKDHWQIHFHGVVVGLAEKEKKKLAKSFRENQKESRGYALVVDKIHDLKGWLDYMSKPTFVSRETAQLRNGTTTQKTRLSISEENELADWLSGYRSDQRKAQIGREYWC